MSAVAKARSAPSRVRSPDAKRGLQPRRVCSTRSSSSLAAVAVPPAVGRLHVASPLRRHGGARLRLDREQPDARQLRQRVDGGRIPMRFLNTLIVLVRR